MMLYDKLFTIENTNDIPEDKTYNDYLNPESLVKLEGAKVEPSLKDAKPGEKFQFVRNAYFVADTKYPNTFNRVVVLKDSFPKK
jgi:glutaminyl-tRNA synthetase